MARKNKEQRCILTGKLTKGKDVILANELLNFIEKQGTNFVLFQDGELEIKKIKLTKNTDKNINKNINTA